MKNLVIILAALIIGFNTNAQKLKPYVLGAVSNKSMAATKSMVKANLVQSGLMVLGEYMPANDTKRWIIAVTSKDLISAVKKEQGLTGFAAVLRVAITVEGSKVNITYTNPMYWGNAYFRDNFPKVEANYKLFSSKMISAMKKSGVYMGTYFGSEDGVDIDDLRDYQYMFGMPEFDDVVSLGEFSSFEAAKAKVDANIKKGIPGVKLVYAYQIPGTKLKLYGFAINGVDGESSFMPIIDLGSPKHTAFLPYEVLINDNEVIMLHGRYRIAVAFPDLSMSTFSKIMSTPGNIEDALEKVCK